MIWANLKNRIYLLILALSQVACLSQHSFHSEAMKISEVQDWEYRWGESPIDAKGNYVWLLETNNATDWVKTGYADSSEKIFQNKKKEKTLWVRGKIPSINLTNPNLMTFNLMRNSEIYINEKKIRTVSNVLEKRYFTLADVWPFIELNRMDFPAQTILTLKIDVPENFLIKPYYYGNYDSLLFFILFRDGAQIIIGFFCLFLSVILIFVMNGLAEKKAILSLAILALSAAFFLIPNNFTTLVMAKFFPSFIPARVFLMMSMIIGMVSGVTMFTESIFGKGPGSIIRRLWQTYLLFGITAILAGIKLGYGFKWMVAISPFLFTLVIAGSIITMVYALTHAFHGDTDARIIVAGFVCFSAAGINDSIGGLKNTPDFQLSLHWGILSFILSMGWIVKRRFMKAKNQLENYNTDLEQKVKERTEKLEAARSQIIVQEKMASLGSMTAGIAHEIKNPLNFIINFSGISKDMLNDLKQKIFRQGLSETEQNEAKEEFNTIARNLSKIEEHGNRASAIISSMLLHSRSGVAQFQLSDINKLLAESLNLSFHSMRASNPDCNMELRSHYGEIPKINVISQDIARVFLNIINNGMYAGHSKKLDNPDFVPIIEVSTTLVNNYVNITIKDNGAGIDPVVREKIFEPFYTTKPPGQGTGLGLSISYDIIVKEHHGDIKVNSKPGEFTEFIIILPIKR